MKHLLNNLSEEEKNRIREQHEGGMKINTDKFKTLTESKMGDVKTIISEQQAYTNQGDPTLDKVLKNGLLGLGYQITTNTTNFKTKDDVIDIYVIFEKEAEDGRFHRVTYQVYPAAE